MNSVQGCADISDADLGDFGIYFRNPYNPGQAIWTAYRGEGGDIVIPEGVEVIGDPFGSEGDVDKSAITSITILGSVTEINGGITGLFCGFTSLTSVTLQEGVTSIGDETFSGCTSLTNVSLPDGLTEIGACAFADCTDLASIVIPESVTEIGFDAFYGCTSLTSVTLPKDVTIDESAFEGTPWQSKHDEEPASQGNITIVIAAVAAVVVVVAAVAVLVVLKKKKKSAPKA